MTVCQVGFIQLTELNGGQHGELWLSEGQPLLDLSCLYRHINVWLEDMPCPEQYDYSVQEIVYTWSNRNNY